MKTRLISGACYVAILVTAFLLKIFWNDFFFDGLIYAFALLGTYEIIRALKDKMTKTERIFAFIFAVVSIPACAITEYFYQTGLLVTGGCFLAFALAVLSLFVADYDNTSVESVGVTLLSGAYPALFLCVLVLTNHAVPSSALQAVGFNSNLLILLIFTVSPIADTFAYLFGMSMGKKFPRKMSPKISPNKTVIGGIGGLFGGVVASVIIYFTYGAVVVGKYVNMGLWLPVYAVIGFLTAVATAFGDLTESALKRKVGIKDMGKIMPGHGGAMDRIDGTLFACIAVYVAFILLRAVV